MPHAQYIVIDNAVSKDYITTMLGSVVNDHTRPYSGIKPRFRPSSANITPGSLPIVTSPDDYTNLESLMKGFYTDNKAVDLLNVKTRQNHANDREVNTKLLNVLESHYRKDGERNIDIVAAQGHRYHLHDAINVFREDLWSNKFYRDEIGKVIEQARLDNTLKTMKEYHISERRNSDHTCEVVLLHMIVGIITCENVRVKYRDQTGSNVGGSLNVPVGKMLNTNGVPAPPMDVKLEANRGRQDFEDNTVTIKEEVICGVSYNLIAIPQGTPPRSNSQGFFGRCAGWIHNILGSSNKPCLECKKHEHLGYTKAWDHGEARYNTDRAFPVYFGDRTHPRTAETQSIDSETSAADLEPEFYIQNSERVVLLDDLKTTPTSETLISNKGCSIESMSTYTDSCADFKESVNIGMKSPAIQV